ncbi:MAG: MMPL family transporter [Ktedonobacteraceae bacterium]
MRIQEDQPQQPFLPPIEASDESTTSTAVIQTDASLAKQGFYRLGLAFGRVVYRFRWIIIIFWLVGLGVSLPFTISVAQVLTGSNFSLGGSESDRVDQLLVSKLHQTGSQVLVVFQAAHTPVSDPVYQHEIQTFISKAQTLAHVTSVNSGGTGIDGRTSLVVVTYNTSWDFVESHLSNIHALLPQDGTSNPAHAYLTGGPVLDDQVSQITTEDIAAAEFIALPIALLVLLLVFRSLVAALMPILLALVAVPIALAVIYAIAVHLSTSIFVLNVASIIGLGISIDYSLFMTRRFREELAQGRTPQEAIAWMVATSGEAILFSGLTVMIGFLGLLFIGIPFMTSFGIGGAVVVLIAVLAALTLLPAMLSVLGPRINALHLPLLDRLRWSRGRKGQKAAENGGEGSFWRVWAEAVMRRPVLVLVVTSLLLIGMGWPIFSINIGSSDAAALPRSSAARQGFDILSAQFPAVNTDPVSILVQTPDGSSILQSANLARVEHLTQWLTQQAHVTNVTSLTHLPAAPDTPTLPEAQLVTLYSTGAYQRNAGLAQFVTSTTQGDTTLIAVDTNAKKDSVAGKALIDQLRAGDKGAAQGLMVLVGGSQASSLDYNRALYGKFPVTVLFILLATYMLLLAMFRSVLLPLKAVLMNVLSVCAALGMLVFIFQWGNLSNLLNFTASGFIDSPIPALMFCILFGLSMDYEVFLLSRMREEWLRTHDNRKAVALGLEKTGGVITNAALLFVIVTGAFTFTRLLVTKEMGLGMTLAVLVDATIIRSLLVPATMRLLGKWNWWFPGRKHD